MKVQKNEKPQQIPFEMKKEKQFLNCILLFKSTINLFNN